MTHFTVLSELRQKLEAAIACSFMTKREEQIIINSLNCLSDKSTWNSLFQTKRLKVLRNVPCYARPLAKKVYRLGVDKRKFPPSSVFRDHGCRIFFFRMKDTLVIIEIGDHYHSLMVGEPPDFSTKDGVYYACDLDVEEGEVT